MKRVPESFKRITETELQMQKCSNFQNDKSFRGFSLESADHEGATMAKLLLALSILLLMAVRLFAASPVDTHGALAVSGNQIVGSKDSLPVQVAGVSHYWSIWGGEKFYTKETVDWLVKDWNVTLTRAAMAVEVDSINSANFGYWKDPVKQKGLVKTVVDASIANGIYVIVDFHSHSPNHKIEQAKTFFGEMALEYKDVPNLIWEIWNEPDGKGGSGANGRDTWADIKEYAAEIIPVIREHSSNLIIVGTPTWCQDVNVASLDPIAGPNIAYALHFYAGTHGAALRTKAQTALDNGIALFISEFGLTHSDGGTRDTVVYTDLTNTWLDWADERGISWANWSLVNKTEVSAAIHPQVSQISGFREEQLRTSGRWIRNRLRERRVYEYDPIIPDTLTLPGRLQAEHFVAKSPELAVEIAYDFGGGDYLDSAIEGSWAEYVLNVPEAGSYKLSGRIAFSSGMAWITLKVDGAVKTSLITSSSGGFDQWGLTDHSPSFELPAGLVTVRLEWGGMVENLARLNWLDFIKETEISIRHSILTPAATHTFGQLITRPGAVSFTVSSDVSRISLLSLSGRLLYSIEARGGRMEIPMSSGMHLLRFEKKSGAAKVIRLIGL